MGTHDQLVTIGGITFDCVRYGADRNRDTPGVPCRTVKFRALVQILERDGWRLVTQRGSHRQYRHPTKPGRVTVAGRPNQDVAPGTLGSVFRQAGLSTKEEH